MAFCRIHLRKKRRQAIKSRRRNVAVRLIDEVMADEYGRTIQEQKERRRSRKNDVRAYAVCNPTGKRMSISAAKEALWE